MPDLIPMHFGFSIAVIGPERLRLISWLFARRRKIPRSCRNVEGAWLSGALNEGPKIWQPFVATSAPR